MTSNRFALLGALAFLGAMAIFGLPSSVWWDTGAVTPRILFGLGIAGWAFVLYDIITKKND